MALLFFTTLVVKLIVLNNIILLIQIHLFENEVSASLKSLYMHMIMYTTPTF